MATVCDVTFRVGRTKSPLLGHKTDLVQGSDVFRAMLCGPLAEKGHIDVPDVESHHFKEFLRFLHKGSCDIDHENAMSMLYLSKKYAVCRLELLCMKFLHQTLAPENAPVILEHAHMFNEKHLYEEAFKVIIRNFRTIGDDVCNLCGDCFRKIVSKSSLKTNTLFQAAIMWADAECRRQGREITLKNVISCIGEYFVMVPIIDLNRGDQDVKSKRLITDDDLEKMMSLSQHKGENRFLFKRRADEKAETEANSLITADIILYNNHSQLASLSKAEKAEDGIDFSFNTNVLLIGVYLYKPERENAHIRLTVQKFLVPVCLEDNEYDIIESEDEESPRVEICLNQPLPLMRNVRYCMYASMDNQPTYVGDRPRSTVTVGECRFTKERQEYVDTVNLVCGFRIGYSIGQ